MIHSVGSCNYLKLEDTNHLLFACQFYDNRQIWVQEQYNDLDGNTHFQDIYKVKINEITLRELMLVQSIFACRTQSDIELLVKDQPEPTVFFKVFLELGVKSMVTYLAFDSRSIKVLLDEKNKKFFKADFPVFYRNKDGSSAIDEALANNQLRTVGLMIDYIIEFQNNHCYASLFENNLVELINKGVKMEKLFNSKVFQFQFDYDEWPSQNSNIDRQLAPYNESFFKIRYKYGSVYPKQL